MASSSLKFSGTLVYVGKVQRIVSQKSGKEFVKRDIAIVDDPDADFPTVLVCTLKKSQKEDRTKLVTDADVNRECEVSFFPDGRFYDDKQTGERKAMAGNTAWKIEFTGVNGGTLPDAPEPDQETVESASQDAENLPF